MILLEESDGPPQMYFHKSPYDRKGASTRALSIAFGPPRLIRQILKSLSVSRFLEEAVKVCSSFSKKEERTEKDFSKKEERTEKNRDGSSVDDELYLGVEFATTYLAALSSLLQNLIN